MHVRFAPLLILPTLVNGWLTAAVAMAAEVERPHYVAPTWQPRAVLPAAEALRGDFWPASPNVTVDYHDPGFATDRLPAVPAPDVHPRVVVTPTEVERIRAKIALGERAPLPFRVMWERVKSSQSAFYALVAQDDVLGRKLAAQLAASIATLEPKLDKLDQQPDRDNLWAVERSLQASGDPNPPTEIWGLLEYDYLHGWMTTEERAAARRVIARITRGRISNFMAVPDHFMINNHQGFGMEFIRLLLLIEGEPGFDRQVFDLAARKARAMLDWYLNQDGMCFESIKGWLNVSAFVAVGMRQRDLLQHSHLRAKMDFFRAALRWEDGKWQIRDEMRASAFHVIWMMHHFHPTDEKLDLLYRASLTSHDFLTDAKAKWPNPVGIVPELLLAYADDGMAGPDGKPLDWNDQARIDRLGLPLTWKDNQRGYLETRNTWRKDDLHLGFTCKQDFFYGGHEGSENNRLTLWHGGVNWIQDLNMLATKHTALQNMVTIDGKGQQWPPVPGVWLGVQESPLGVTAAGDGRMGYTYAKRMQVHPLDFPSAKLPYYAPFSEGNFDLTRDLQVAFHPDTVRWNDGFAHTDYGPWSGETRLVEHYREWNPVEQAFRTVHLARGERPYVLVFDDLKKDAQSHLFEWNISLPPNCDLVEGGQGAEIQFQAVEPTDKRESSFLFASTATPRDPKTGRMVPKKGDPLFLVKVLWRNSQYGFPSPRLARMRGHNGVDVQGSAGFAQFIIPAISVSPEFRVLLYPHRAGDPLPVTTWNQDRSELNIELAGQRDQYRLGRADGGRTVFAMTRNDQPVVRSEQPPARPVFAMDGQLQDLAALRTTREDGKAFTFRFAERTAATLVRPNVPTVIRYTLDGSEPNASSPLYEAPVELTASCTLTARTFDPRWTAGNQASESVRAHFIRENLASGLMAPPAGAQPGLLAQVYEVKTVMWNDRGFFDAQKIMLPKVSSLTPSHASVVDGFILPQASPTRPVSEQVKGFYRWTGWFFAEAPGSYAFRIDSCGPLALDVGGRKAIEHLGVFHQQQAVRQGDVLLGRGWHPVELVVCDPIFWNLGTFEPMPFALNVRLNGGPDLAVTREQLRCLPGSQVLAKAPAINWHPAIGDLPQLEPGATLTVYERSGRQRDRDYLDIDDATPVRSAAVNRLETNLKPGLVRVYRGWFKAPTDGIYTWDTPARRAESVALGELRSAYQNQLRVGNEIVVQRGVAGRYPLRQVGLRAGWHPVELRLGASPASVTVTYPDGQTVPVTAELLARPVLVDIRPTGAAQAQSDYEIFAPTTVTLALTQPGDTVLRYTLDGSVPTSAAPAYSAPLAIAQTTTITAVAFRNGRASTSPARVTLHRVEIPEANLLADSALGTWDGRTGVVPLASGSSLWLPPDAQKMPGVPFLRANPAGAADQEAKPKSTDVNLTKGGGKVGFKLTRLNMLDNAITVALRFRSDRATGKLFGKDGYNTYGKAYKTISCGLTNGRVVADPGRLGGGKILPGTWHEVVLTGDERALTLYLDGEVIANGPGMPTLTTDALDVLSEHTATVARMRVYNRVLNAAEVQQLFRQSPLPAP